MVSVSVMASAWDEAWALVAALVWDAAIPILSAASIPGYRAAGGRMAAVKLPLSHRRRLTARQQLRLPSARHMRGGDEPS